MPSEGELGVEQVLLWIRLLAAKGGEVHFSPLGSQFLPLDYFTIY